MRARDETRETAAAEDFREDIARRSHALTGGASDADGKCLFHNKVLARIRSGNVSLLFNTNAIVSETFTEGSLKRTVICPCANPTLACLFRRGT